MNCTGCKTELKGSIDTFGDVGEEFCLNCYLSIMSEFDADAIGLFPPGNEWKGDEVES